MSEPAVPPSEKEAENKDAKPAKVLAPVLLKGEIKIFPDKRLPYLDQGSIKAYEAQGAGGEKAFAMVCERNVIPQIEIVHKYMTINSPYLPKLLACGVVDWTPDFKERFVFVYENKLGNPISVGKDPMAMGLKPDTVISTIFRNLLDVLRAMQDNGVPHGSIRVENIFDGGNKTLEGAMLGEMLSVPSGYAQPVFYETIPRALAAPLARGIADYADDIYAFGITVSALMRTHNPIEGLSDDEIIAQKIEMGTFNFITAKDRFPGPILEFLRGVLNDDPQLRWNFDDIMTWADGRRVSAKQGSGITVLKASRPLEFARKRFLRPQALAVALPSDAALAMPLIENGDLYLWLNRSLQNKEYEQRYEEAIIEAKKAAGSSNYADRLACATAIALAPEDPVFYRGLKFSPAGFGAMLVDAVAHKKDLSSFVDIIQSSLVSFWSKCNPGQGVGTGDAINRLQNCQGFLAQSIIGYGMERCVYYLAPMAPCLSEKLAGFYVRTAEDFLNAMEKISTSKNRPEWFLDRHIVAFLSVRDKSIIEPFLADIASTEKHRQRQGVLKVFAAIQRRDKMGALPGVSLWIAGMLDCLVDRYHDREQRRQVKEKLEKIKDKGNLERIAALFDNYEAVQNDMKNYTQAMRQFQALKTEYLRLENELDTNAHFGIGAGRQTAALVSGIIAALVVMVYLVYSMSAGHVRVF